MFWTSKKQKIILAVLTGIASAGFWYGQNEIAIDASFAALIILALNIKGVQ